MTAQAALMLVEEILPLIAGAIGKGRVKFVGAEDAEELTQDCVALAAQQLDAAERNGKQFTPGTIAFYAIKNLKSGRRSTGSSTTDVMAAGTQLAGRTALQSMDEPLGHDEDSELDLHDVLACKGEDVGCAVGRRMDWDLVELDDRQRGILRGTAVGMAVKEMAEQYRVTPARIVQLRHGTGERIRDAWGDTGLTDRTPAWKRQVRA